MYTNNRDAYRQTYYDAWQKHQKNLPLSPIEMQLVAVMLQHSEYHPLLENANVAQQFELAENPFFHMSLHLAIQDQIKTNRPFGVTQIYQQLLNQFSNAHHAEHGMMDCLAQMIWQTQQSGKMPDEKVYLEQLQLLILK